MTLLFGRTVRAVVGREGERGVQIEGHTIEFDIQKTKGGKPNKGKIKIFNLSRDLASAVESSRDRNTIQIFAGYGDAAARIFAGEIRKGKARTVQDGADRVTTVEARDGARRYRSARVNRSWDAQVTIGEVVEELGAAFGLPISLPREVENVRLTQGYVASGPARDVLDEVAKILGLDWTLEDGAITVTREDGDTGETAVLLTPTTGLIKVERTNKGCNGVALLNATIRPKRFVEIRHPDLEGFFLVQRVGHKGGNRGRDFYTLFEARAV